MAELIVPAPLAEPEVVPCHLIEGAEIEVRADIVRVVGWIFLEITDEATPAERRIVSRVAMPVTAARALIRDLQRAVGRGGH